MHATVASSFAHKIQRRPSVIKIRKNVPRNGPKDGAIRVALLVPEAPLLMWNGKSTFEVR